MTRLSLMFIALATMLHATALVVSHSPAKGHTVCGDDSESTVIEYQESGASYGPYTAWKQETVPCGETPHDGVRVGDSDSSYRWVRYISGPQACIFTANPRGNVLAQVGGGRNCVGSESGGACGFFQRGYHVYAVSGTSCSAFGIPVCSGICE